MSGSLHPAADPTHPAHAQYIRDWTRRAAASDVIVDPRNPNPLTPEQLEAGMVDPAYGIPAQPAPGEISFRSKRNG